MNRSRHRRFPLKRSARPSARRRLRARFFDEELFADPAWDMMLHLLHADLRQQRVTISTLCAAAHVPATTALRWLKSMSDKGVFIRRDDPFDGRRTYVELAPATDRALRFYFAELAKGSTSGRQGMAVQ